MQFTTLALFALGVAQTIAIPGQPKPSSYPPPPSSSHPPHPPPSSSYPPHPPPSSTPPTYPPPSSTPPTYPPPSSTPPTYPPSSTPPGHPTTTSSGGGGPTGTPPGGQCPNPQVANYDDLGAIPILPISPVPSPYKGLRYQNFNLLGRGLDLLPGSLRPYSTPNSAYFSLLTQVLGGIAKIGTASNTGTFDLTAARFGCSTILGLTRIPFDCTVVATGVNAQGTTSTATFTFTRSETMQRIVFPTATFSGLKEVSFVLVGQPLLDTTFAATFDDLEYCLRN